MALLVTYGLTIFIPMLILGLIIKRTTLNRFYLIKRIIAYLIDTALLATFLGPALAEVMVCGLLCYNPFDSPQTTFTTYSTLFIIIFYFGISESIFGKTLGKKIMGLKVVSRTSNKKPSIIPSMIRTLTRLLVIFDLLPGLFKNHETLHDMFSKTKVNDA